MRTVLYDSPEIEYLDGHPFPKVSPKRTHARVQALIARMLLDSAADRGEVGTEWRFNLGAVDDTASEFVPDVAFVSIERLNGLSEDLLEEPPFAPDIAIEIRSPSDKKSVLARKIERYLATGSVLVLDVNPQARRIIARTSGGTRTYEAGETFATAVVPWLRFSVESIFPKPR